MRASDGRGEVGSRWACQGVHHLEKRTLPLPDPLCERMRHEELPHGVVRIDGIGLWAENRDEGTRENAITGTGRVAGHGLGKRSPLTGAIAATTVERSHPSWLAIRAPPEKPVT